jgi:hypothetical protein
MPFISNDSFQSALQIDLLNLTDEGFEAHQKSEILGIAIKNQASDTDAFNLEDP